MPQPVFVNQQLFNFSNLFWALRAFTNNSVIAPSYLAFLYFFFHFVISPHNYNSCNEQVTQQQLLENGTWVSDSCTCQETEVLITI